MAYFLYMALMTAAAPLGAAYLLLRPKHRPLLRRFAPRVPPQAGKSGRPLWLHACSVGEVNIARPFLQAIEERWPDLPLVLSVSTVSGRNLAQSLLPRTALAWLPFDHPLCVGPFIHKLNPRALVLLDTELWPGLICGAQRAGVPVVLANGRISDKHFPRYKRARCLVKRATARLSAAAMQNEEYAARLVELGARADCVTVCGSTKFDGLPESVEPEKLAALRRQCGLNEADTVLLFGSTRPGDEVLAANCFHALRRDFPRLRLVVAPRHLDRLHDAMSAFTEPVFRRSGAGREPGAHVVFLDTVGELVQFYALAGVAVIGGSFSPGVNGHNPLEPAALGVPTVFGPYMRNFIDPARELLAHKGAVQTTAEYLPDVLRRLLSDDNERQAIGRNGREAVRKNRGAIARTLDIIGPLMEPASARDLC